MLEDLVGRTLGTDGRYRLVRVLGRGGMATVFEGEDSLLDRQVAVKVLTGAASGHGFVERFHREARTAARLDHPHILPIFDFGEDVGLLYLVMRLVRGTSLKQAVHAQATRPELEWVVALSRQ